MRGVLRVAAATAGLAVVVGTWLSLSNSATAPSSTPGPAGGIPARVHLAVDAFNAAAGGSASGQQSALVALLDDGQRAVQGRCPASRTTVFLDPVYGGLTPAPGWRPAGGTLSGTVYALPTLIRIYTGNRITRTDLTDLHVAIDGGRVRFPALCLT